MKKSAYVSKKMTFGENRDLERVVTAPVSSGKKSNVLTLILMKKKHTRFKAACAGKGTSITDVVNQLVDNWLKENE
nr:plasmid partition protein ParG [Escherichia coli]